MINKVNILIRKENKLQKYEKWNPYICRCTAQACVWKNDGCPRIWGAYRKSQDYALFYSAMQLCSSYSGTYCQGLAYEKRTGRVSFLLSFLPGTGWGKQRQENCLLLYIHWRISFSNIRWHDLRSTFCTLLLKNDFNPKAVSKLMGHAKRLLRWMCMEIIERLSLTV